MAYYDPTNNDKLCGMRRIKPAPKGGKKPLLSRTGKLELKLTVFGYKASSKGRKMDDWTKKLKFKNDKDQSDFLKTFRTEFGVTPKRRRMPERKPWQWLAPLAACDGTPSDEIIKAQ